MHRLHPPPGIDAGHDVPEPALDHRSLEAPDFTEGGLPRVAVENVRPSVDGGRFDAKRVIGDTLTVTADVFVDGHDMLRAAVLFRHATETAWREAPMQPLGNDRWSGAFRVERLGRYLYTVRGWVDRFGSWRRDLSRKFEAGLEVSSELLEGAQIVEDYAGTAPGEEGSPLREQARRLRAGDDQEVRVRAALEPQLASDMARWDQRRGAVTPGALYGVTVDPEKGRFSSWYELFPRSASPEPGKHGTLRDVEKRLRYIAGLGFDVLYLPPIHPIGRANRKGRNNSIEAAPNDPGSPWAIGAEEGGHKALHPQLGTLEDFRRLVVRAKEYGIQIALDIAFQATPDHPYVREHPEWFRHRPDGTIKYAENPPKKYQDIYPIEFETSDRQGLWQELKSVVDFWLDQGVRIFRVDNPHTKPFAFWEWLIADVKGRYPEVIFLAEAFSRPRIMYRLAKLGFTQSYTYFTWRNTKHELTEYFTELTQSDVREFFRPNLWPNTPDILNEYLQVGGCPAFMARLVLAATLSGNYGIYGPAFELCENRPLKDGSEEYLDSEKYQIRTWDWDRGGSLRALITRVNWIRREYEALRNDGSLRFHHVDNDHLIAYSKSTPDGQDLVLTVVNLDPHHKQAGWLELPLETMGVEQGRPFEVHDLIGGARYLWQGPRNFVELDPAAVPAFIFHLKRRLRTEQDFDYFM